MSQDSARCKVTDGFHLDNILHDLHSRLAQRRAEANTQAIFDACSVQDSPQGQPCKLNIHLFLQKGLGTTTAMKGLG